jgi:hypothetical protein
MTVHDPRRLILKCREVSVCSPSDFDAVYVALCEEGSWQKVKETPRADVEVPYCWVTFIHVLGRQAVVALFWQEWSMR